MPTSLFEHRLRWLLGVAMLFRLLFPFFDSPLAHLFSDPGRHWQNALQFMHPNIMGATDPFGYQLWLFTLQQLAQDNHALILAATGGLCALMPWGWYRALKELLPRSWALAGAIVIALVPELFSIYAYFMNETLLLTLTGFAFWATFRAQRKRSTSAFLLAWLVWLLTGLTRSMAPPLALVCLLASWLPQPQRISRALLSSLLLLRLLIPAGMHGYRVLHWFTPFGNPYLNQIYNQSGKRIIQLEFRNPDSRYHFGSPSFYNPTFAPFSDWTTDRQDKIMVHIDLSQGRTDWQGALAQAQQQRTFPRSRQMLEDAAYLLFGQPWPNNDPSTLRGRLTLWLRWLWPLMIVLVAYGAARRRYHGKQWLLPACALGLLAYFFIQQRGVMEARFRLPLDPILLAAAIVLLYNTLRASGKLSWARSRSEPSLFPAMPQSANPAVMFRPSTALLTEPAVTGGQAPPAEDHTPILSLVIP